MNKIRLDNISDGIFAIILTLMVIEIRPPSVGTLNTLEFFREIIIYGLSYIVIIILWIHHHYLFSLVSQINNSIIGFNFLLLFFITLIPIPTKILGENFFLKRSHVFYGALMFINMLTFFLLEWVVKRTLLRGSSLHSAVNLKTLALTGLYGISIPLGIYNIYASTIIFLLAPVLYTVLTKKERSL